MPSATAFRKCPDGVFLPPDFPRYTAVSREIRTIFREVTPLVEPLSLDEAYLDVTDNLLGEVSATRVAKEILQRIKDRTRLTASAGVAPNKFLAKVGSDMQKPDGLTVIPPEQVEHFVEVLPVRKVPGIGPVTERHCHAHGIQVCGDFLSHSEETLVELFGKAGRWFRDIARGHDPRPVVPDHVRKSASVEDTFPRDLDRREEAQEELVRLASLLEGRLVRADTRGRTVTLKVKYADFRVVTRSATREMPVQARDELLAEVLGLMDQTDIGREPVRLLGIGVSNLVGETDEEQLYLPFPAPEGSPEWVNQPPGQTGR